jgi:hypothetical protein
MKFRARALELGGEFQPFEGDLSLGGAFIQGRNPPTGKTCELEFRLPEHDAEYRVEAELLRIRDDGRGLGKGVHLRFSNLDVETELAIAKYLDDLALQRAP